MAATAPATAAQPTAAAAAPAKPGGVLTWGATSYPLRFNPQYTTNTASTEVYDNIYDTLVRRDPDLKLLPGLATEWNLLNDTTWQFKLRPNVKFHNGDPFTAADAKFTIERTWDPDAKTIHATVFQTVKSIDVVDDLTLNFTMKSPDALLPARTSYYGGYIMPAKYFQAVGSDDFEKKPVGTGPFKVVEAVKDDHLTLEANADYWGGAPNVSRVILRPLPEDSARVGALRAGDATFADTVPDDQVDKLNQADTTKAMSVPLTGMRFLIVNTTKPPLNNKLVRQALSLATDRESINKSLMFGRGYVANGPIPRGELGYDPNQPSIPYDPAKAKAQLSQAGYKGEEILLEFLPSERTLNEAIGAMWKDAGINVNLQVLESSVRSQKLASGTFTSVFSAFFVSTLGDPAGLMWRALGPNGVLAPYWSNDEWVSLGKQNDTTLDQTVRGKNFARMSQIMLDEMPWVITVQPPLNYGMAKSVQWRPHPNYMVDFRKGNLSLS